MENLTTQLEDLFAAIRHSDVPQVKRLLAANVSPIQANHEGQTAMMVAVQTGHVLITQLLCKATATYPSSAQIFFDASTPAVSLPSVLTTINMAAATPIRSLSAPLTPIPLTHFFHMPAFNHSAQIDIGEVADASIVDQPAQKAQKASESSVADGRQALEVAVCHNDLDEVKRLLNAGVSFRPANWYDTPVLVTAAKYGYSEVVQLLIDAGANVNSGCDRLPLHIASECGHIEVVLRLLNSDAYIQATEDGGRTALMAAAAAGQLKVVQLLIARGANANATCRGEMPLMMAAKNGHEAVCKALYPYSSPQIVQRKISVLTETAQFERDIALLAGLDTAR